MNDRFGAQLRQHLVDTANEHAADGQIAAIVEGVAHTSQRHPLAARLRWNAGRLGGVPSVAIRYSLIAAALALAAVAGSMLAGTPKSASTVFEGTWITIDPGDHSGMTLVVGPGTTPVVYFEDGFATGAACVEDEVKRFTARGFGEILGDRLVATFPDGGGCGRMTVAVAGAYDYDSSRDELADQDGLIWNRALAEQRPATPAPPTDAPLTTPLSTPLDTTPPDTTPPDMTPTDASPAPSTSVATKCTPIPAGGTYANTVGALSVAMTVPADAGFAWDGYRDGFSLEGSCPLSYPIVIQAAIVSVVQAACDQGGGTAVATPAEVVAVLAASQAYQVAGQTSVTVGGYAATRLEIPSSSSTCPGAIQLWDGQDVGVSATTVIYVVDVEGVALGIAITNRNDEAPPAQIAEAEAIVATLEVVPQ